MHAVIYLRVSTEEQAESGLGMEAQEHSCRRWCEAHRCDVAGVHCDEGVSGSVAPTERPGLRAALAGVERGDVLLVAKRDRLARDVYYACIVERAVTSAGGRLVSAAGEGTDDDSPTSVLMRRILDAFGEYERLLIGMRTAAALGAKRRRGEYTGGRVPVGRTVGEGGVLVDSGAVGFARRLRAEGCSLRDIGRKLGEAGLWSPTGRPYSASSVARMVEGD